MRHTTTQRRSGGFTLVEMLVSIAVFTIAMLVITGALMRLTDASRKAQSIRTAMDNVGVSMESMSRVIRTSKRFHCGPSGDLNTPVACPISASGSDFLSMDKADGDPSTAADNIVFRQQFDAAGKGRIERSLDGGTTWSVVSPPDINITELTFHVNGATLDEDQGLVSVTISGFVDRPGLREDTTFTVQTSIASRYPNFSDGNAFYGGTPPVSSGTNRCNPAAYTAAWQAANGAAAEPPHPSSMEREDDNASCSDGSDNDCDLLVDCNDYIGTQAGPSTRACMDLSGPGEACDEICYDGIDNNNNGQVDCADMTPCGQYGMNGDPDIDADDQPWNVNPYGCQEIQSDYDAPQFGTSPTGGQGYQPFAGNYCQNGVNENNPSNLGDAEYRLYHPGATQPFYAYEWGVDCADNLYCAYTRSGQCFENCWNDVDDYGAGGQDCTDFAQCRAHPGSPEWDAHPELDLGGGKSKCYENEWPTGCTDGFDNNKTNGKDCQDSDCWNDPSCSFVTNIDPTVICFDGSRCSQNEDAICAAAYPGTYTPHCFGAISES